MFDVCEEFQMSFGFQIYLNGMVVFKYLPDGCGKLNDVFMDKKIATVMLTGRNPRRTASVFCGDILLTLF